MTVSFLSPSYLPKREKSSLRNSNYLIIKPLNDSTCTLRHDRDAGVYIITPVIPEGVITLRVGYMDFLGAYKRVDEIDFTVVAEQPKQE